MTVIDTLDNIRRAGGKVWVEAGSLRVKAPPGTVRPEHKAVLAANKAALLSLLDAPATSPSNGAAPAATAAPIAGELTWFETLPEADQQQHLDLALAEWQVITDTTPTWERTGGKAAVNPLVAISTTTELEWCDGPDRYTYPKGSPGWLVIDPADIPDQSERLCITDTLRNKAKNKIAVAAVWLGGRPRVVPLGSIRIEA